jgi:hypothetical protein
VIRKVGAFFLSGKMLDISDRKQILDRLRAIPELSFCTREDERVSEDLGITGDDAVSLFDSIHEIFEVDLSEMRWEEHFAHEGMQPFLLIFFSRWFPSWYTPKLEVRVSHIIDSIQTSRWVYKYPADRR